MYPMVTMNSDIFSVVSCLSAAEDITKKIGAASESGEIFKNLSNRWVKKEKERQIRGRTEGGEEQTHIYRH